jgi:hypothetical protein
MLLVACTRVEKAQAEPATAAATGPASATATATPTATTNATADARSLEGEPLGEIDIGGGEKAWLALPVGAKDARAIVVGVHGAGDRADWSCSEWQAVTAGWAIVVCPHGVRHPTDPNAYVWSSADAIATTADRAVRAVRAKYAPWIADVPLVYGGWSQGGSLAADVVASRPGFYDRVVLVEVGHTPLDAADVAKKLEAGGVKRVVVSCSSWKCRAFAGSFARAAARRTLAVQTNDVGLRGHWFDEPVFRTLAPRFAWMVDDDARYAGLGAAIDARWVTD